MTRSLVLRALILLACAGAPALTACGGDDGNASTTPTSTAASTNDAERPARAPHSSIGYPNSIAVLGHSGATGEGTDPRQPRATVPENSWATGTNPDVNSVYLRILARNPLIRARNVNLARGGATVDALVDQARTAAALDPKPELFVIQIMDNDIECPLSQTNAQAFGSAFRTALDILTTAAPRSTMFVVSQFGSPDTYARSITRDERISVGGSGACDFIDQQGRFVPRRAARLDKAIHGYEFQLKGGCQRFPRCRHDDGAFGRVVDRRGYVSSDLNHLSIQGHAKAASVAWTAMQRTRIVPTS